MNWKTIAEIRREYGSLNLTEANTHENPFSQFKIWFEEANAEEKSDPTEMTLSTVDEKGFPDARVVLLKGLDEVGFIFYSNYLSVKGLQLKQKPYAALTFYWPRMSRQVRIRGRVKRTSQEQSDAYFSSRPVSSQFAAIISPQSHQIKSHENLDLTLQQLTAKHGQKPITRPKHWGGYIVIPFEIEFWQGRDNRLHDRISYHKMKGKWTRCRLAP
ncbi:MAG: pyridoxamine 5'-phosphate oxidase [Tatlockia sp.]|nr:pyridoxamine 5'-phosphate oxidase [Tatlockia sp.]